jgi:hypothetical protein
LLVPVQGEGMAGEPISARLRERIWRDFPDPCAAKGIEGALRKLAVELEDSRQSPERLLTAGCGDRGRGRGPVSLGSPPCADGLA